VDNEKEMNIRIPSDDEFLEKVAGVMTSGMPQKGAKYTLPESMVLELLKDTYVDGFRVGLALAEQAAMQAYVAGFEDAKLSKERSQ
jgi:hypothetical protein